ncbi:MAG: sulfite exporter TauE/SafE family protein [Clostridiaceae bacterium]|nr:sulfite exporter TauE/SafE family protein [Clostridiaceae bacterium]
MNNVSLMLAFSAGLLSFLSPCVLPLVPAYITYLTGSSIKDINTGKAKLNALYKSIGFVIGFSIIFIIMGASFSTLGKLLISNQEVFRKIGGILIIVFGVHITGLFKIKIFYSEKRFLSRFEFKGKFSSVLMGMAFAAGWTPCIGPILSSILIYAGSMDTINKGILLLVVYSLGLAVPFLLTAFAIDSLSKYFRKITPYLPTISVISGIIVILMGVMVFTNKVNIMSRFFSFINV